MNSTNFWPASIQGAVCLTFDDGCQSQLDNAIPCLDDAGLRGTFYVNPGRSPRWEQNHPGWRLACIKGYEIGNHTTEHPCSCNYGFRPDGYCLENLTFADMEETIDAATAELDRLFPEQRGGRTFSYPCYQTYVGAGETAGPMSLWLPGASRLPAGAENVPTIQRSSIFHIPGLT